MIDIVRHQTPDMAFVVRVRGTWRTLWRKRYYLVDSAGNPADAMNRVVQLGLVGEGEFAIVFPATVTESKVTRMGRPKFLLRGLEKINEPPR